MPWTGIFSLSAVTKKEMETGSQRAVWERGYMKIAYKAFRPDLSCQAGGSTYQYQLQKWNEIKEAKCRETGFHCAEDPLDCLSYYPVWEQAVYYMVAADGDIDEDACDSKIACTRLRLLKKMTKEEYIYVALVYMGSTTEQGLRLAADALRPYAADIAARADAGQLILLTGNAPDVFSAAIESDSADTIEGLGILPGRVRYTMMKRHNSFFLGTFDGMEVVGFKSLFGFHYDAAEAEGWFDTVRGVGRTPESKPEGFRRGGLYATALIGPLLILNPPLCKWLLRQLGAEDTLAFEDAAFASFNKRVAEFKEPGRGFQYS